MGVHLGKFLGLAALVVVVTSANGAERLRYTFNDGVAISGNTVLDNEASSGIGNQITFVNPGGLGQIAGGYADLRNNNGRNSAQDWIGGTAIGTYLDMADYSFADSVFNGTAGAGSIEMWVTIQENRGWARLWDIGSSDGENPDVSSGGGASDYVIGVPAAGMAGDPFLMETHSTAGGGAQHQRTPAAPLATGVEHHIVFTVDQTAAAKLEFPNGVATMYLNGAEVARGAIHNGDNGAAAIDISNMIEDNSWFGRAQYGDPLLDALINEVSIHDNALTLAQVESEFAAGAEVAALPVVTIDRSTGMISLTNNSGVNSQITGYSLSSAAGGLDVSGTGWKSIDTGNTFDPNGTWTTSSLTASQISEAVTGGTTDGGALGDGASVSLGNAWLRSPISDIKATVSLNDGTVTGALVNYVGDAINFLDLDGDGSVDADDYFKYADYAFTDMTGLTEVERRIRGDMDNDGDNDFTDFAIFKSEFNALQGAGALEAIMAGSGVQVPEPAGFVMAAFAAVGAMIYRGRKSRMSTNSKRLVASLLGVIVLTASACPSRAELVMDWDASDWDANVVGTWGGGAASNDSTWVDKVGGIVAYAGIDPNNVRGPEKNVGQIGGNSLADYIALRTTTFDVLFGEGANPTSPLNGLREYTMSIVVRMGDFDPVNIPENNFWQYNGIMGRELGGPGVGDWALGVTDLGDNQQAVLAAGNALGGGDIGTVQDPPVAFDDNTWRTVHMKAVDNGDDTWSQFLYVDGIQVGSDENIAYGGTQNLTGDSFGFGAIFAGTGPQIPQLDIARIQFHDAPLDDSDIAAEAANFLSEGVQEFEALNLVLGPGGAVTIENNNVGTDFTIDAYEIVADTDAFNRTNWNSLEDQGIDVGGGMPDGDFNSDGTTNLADYTVWRDNLGSTGGLPNDGGLDGTIDADYYQLWKDNFGATEGGDGLGWTELSGADPTEDALREAFLGEEGSTIAAGEEWSLGSPFLGGTSNITFRYRRAGAWTTGTVSMSGALQTAQVPEPATVSLLLITAGLVAGVRCRSRLRK